ncbi:MAG: leucine-rich repeat protein [Prevotellaceae bacterium]|jgi:hypothetical protein|nr:leucine-rich repeat protein [Prevotellaceae bacterium]
MKKLLTLMLAAAAIAVTGCKEDEPKSAACDITAFTVNSTAWNISGNDITYTFPPETAATTLTPTITLSPGATIDPPSGVAQDFFTGTGVTYTVTAEDGVTKKTYTAKATRTPHTACEIVSFTVDDVAWNISGSDITYTFPSETAATTLTPTITLSPGATIDPPSGVAQDFFTGTGVTYTVTAEDGVTKKTYTAKATIQATASGTTGSCTWTLTGAAPNYTLTISGNGAMGDYDVGDINRPSWYLYRDDIKTVVIQEGVTTVGTYVFYLCSGLVEVTIPSSVITIDNSAFFLCSSLTAINVDGGNMAYSSIDGVLFNKDQTILMYISGGKSGAYTIPNSVLTIGVSAFLGTSLTEVTIPNSVTTISEMAFIRSESLRKVIMGNGVTTIGEYAFYGCSGLSEITIPGLVTVIDTGVFANCFALREITIPNSVTTISEFAFQRTGLSEITIPNSVAFISVDAFYRCESLTAINVNGSNTAYLSVDGVLFNKDQTTLITYPCGKFGSYIIPGEVNTIGIYAFQYCTGLTGVTIPASVNTIENYAFIRCTGLIGITNYNPEPQPVATNVFGNNTTGVNKTTCILQVPAGSVAAYKAATVWKDFVNIEAIP